MKKLVILVGNIGCGKTTLAQKYQKKGYVVIARDQLRYAIGNGNYVFKKEYEPIIFSTELYMLKEFLTKGVNIVIDEVGISFILRKRYIDIAEEYGYKIICHILPRLPIKEAVRRRMKNPHGQYDKKIWRQVWTRFNKMYEEPVKEEGFYKIIKEK